VCTAYKQQQEWEKKRSELLKSAAKGFFSPVHAAGAASLSAGDDESMCVTPANLLHCFL
jgi:hypothetical protein